jgi:trypsin-like peptidase
MVKSVFLLLFSAFLYTPLFSAAIEAPREPEASCASLNETDCPAGVALLLSKKNVNDSEIDRCSSFLINSRTLVTNRHCIPEDLREKNLPCAGRLTAVFPKTLRFAAERAECESILSISPEASEFSVGHPDFAVIRLNRPMKRVPFRVSREGLPNRIKLTAYSFDPLPGSPLNATLYKKTCESLQNTELIPNYIDALSPVASFTGCQIIRGNSGSVAVDEQGWVRAVIHATWPLPKNYVPFSVMTNMACIELPSDFAPRDSRCDESRPMVSDFKALYANAPKMNFDSEFLAFQTANHGQFRFKKSYVAADDRKVLIPQITCVEKAALQPLMNAPTSEAMLSLSLPIWGPDKFITADYRYTVVPTQISKAYTTVQFDVAQLLSQGHTVAREIRGSFFIYSDRKYSLPLCRNPQ